MPNKDVIENLESGFSRIIEKQLEKYMSLHKGGEVPPGLYQRILNEVEKSLFTVTLKYCNENQLKAAKILGINRNTLRNKMLKIRSGADHI